MGGFFFFFWVFLTKGGSTTEHPRIDNQVGAFRGDLDVLCQILSKSVL